ncbi:MAG: hypothetical protein KGM15_10780, partial [Pseudomonadota bacterium]|nr:hypothetical protein [Pseudomonadota bacterium]
RFQAQTVVRRGPQLDLHSFLVGKLYDDRGNRMGASYACKGSKRFRYYVSRPALIGDAKLAGSLARVSAPEIESTVIDAVQRHLAPRTRTSGDRDREPRASPPPWGQQPIAEMLNVIERVIVHASKIEIVLNEASAYKGEAPTLTLPFAPTQTRRKRQIILRTEASAEPSRAMRANARAHFKVAIFDARRWLDELIADPSHTVEMIAAREHRSPRSLRMTLSLAFLSPELVKAALEGRLPRGLNARRMTEMPMLWSDQWRALGLQTPAARVSTNSSLGQ